MSKFYPIHQLLHVPYQSNWEIVILLPSPFFLEFLETKVRQRLDNRLGGLYQYIDHHGGTFKYESNGSIIRTLYLTREALVNIVTSKHEENIKTVYYQWFRNNGNIL